MRLVSSNDGLKFGFLVFTVLVSLNFWAFLLVPEIVNKLLDTVITGILVLIVLYHSYIFKRKLNFKAIVLFFMLIPVLSSLGALMFHGQALKLTLFISRVHLFWLFYFVLHLFDPPKEKVIKLVIFVGLVWAGLTIVQQLTYPTYYFASRIDSEDNSIYRGGVYRYSVPGLQYGAFVLFFYLYRYFETRKFTFLLIVLVALIGYYCYGTRQYFVGIAACLGLSLFMVKGRSQLAGVTLFLIMVPVLLLSKDYLFGQLIEMTKDQWKYGDDIRKLSGIFWLFEYWPNHWLARFTGNGSPHVLSSYGREMELIRLYKHFYRSDVGIIGAFNEYGLLYVFNVVATNVKALQNRFYTKNNKYIKLIFFYGLVILITSQNYTKSGGMVFYSLIFFLLDKSLDEKNRAAELEHENEEEEQLQVAY